MVIARVSTLETTVKAIFAKAARTAKQMQEDNNALSACQVIEQLRKDVCEAIESHESFGGALKF